MRRARERCSQCSTRIPPRTADLLEGSALTISSSKPSDRQSPPALLAQLDADARYTADHKQKMRAEITAAAQQQFDTAHATYRQDQLRDIGQKEGAARAALLNNPPSLDPYAPDGERVKAHIRLAHEANTQRRIDLDLRDLDATTDLADVVDMFDEAEAHGGEIMRRVGKHAVRCGARPRCMPPCARQIRANSHPTRCPRLRHGSSPECASGMPSGRKRIRRPHRS